MLNHVGGDLLNPPYSINNAAGVLSNRTVYVGLSLPALRSSHSELDRRIQFMLMGSLSMTLVSPRSYRKGALLAGCLTPRDRQPLWHNDVRCDSRGHAGPSPWSTHARHHPFDVSRCRTQSREMARRQSEHMGALPYFRCGNAQHGNLVPSTHDWE